MADNEEKKTTASDVAFAIFIVLLLICIVLWLGLSIGMSRGSFNKQLGQTTTISNMIDPIPKAVVKTGPMLVVGGATVISALVLIIIYYTKKTKKDTKV